MQGAIKKYKDIDTEVKAYSFGSNDYGIDMADKLLSYKDGAVMEIFQRGNLSNNEKASMLDAVGNQFKRDVVLKEAIDGAKSGLSSIKDMNWDDKTKASMTSLLNNLIKNWTKQQDEITEHYGL